MKQTLSYCKYYTTYHWYLDNDLLISIEGWMNPNLLRALGYEVEALPEYPDYDRDAYDFFDHPLQQDCRFVPPQSRMLLLQQFTAYKKHKQQQRMSQLLEEMKILSKEMVP